MQPANAFRPNGDDVIDDDIVPLGPHLLHLLVDFIDLRLDLGVGLVNVGILYRCPAPTVDPDLVCFGLGIDLNPPVDPSPVFQIVIAEIILPVWVALLIVLLEIALDVVLVFFLALNPPKVGAGHARLGRGIPRGKMAVFAAPPGVIVGRAELVGFDPIGNHTGAVSVSMARDSASARLPTCFAHFESSISAAASP